MLVPDRRRAVLDHVRRHGSAQVEQLAQTLGVSAWTVRRDLAELESQGQLRRTHGGAFLDRATPVVAPPPSGDDDAKARIGRLAAERLVDGSTVLVLPGSTTGAMLPHLRTRRLTVVTNGVEIAYELRHAPDVSLVVLGGLLHREQMTLLGPLTEGAMGDLHVDLIVAGAYGVDPQTGVTGAKIIAAGAHHGMLRHTDALMVLADATKLGRRGPTLLAATDRVDTLITDRAAAPEVVDELRRRGPEVILA